MTQKLQWAVRRNNEFPGGMYREAGSLIFTLFVFGQDITESKHKSFCDPQFSRASDYSWSFAIWPRTLRWSKLA